MALLTGTQLRQVNTLEQRDRSQDLEWFRLRRFDRMAAHLRQLLPNSGMALRAVPLVSRVSKELAPFYIHRPSRTWSQAGAQVGGARGLEGLQAALRGARLDQFMRTISERLVVHHAQIVTVEPRRVPAAGGGLVAVPGALALRGFSPFEAQIQHRDLNETDPRYAERIELLVPVHVNDSGSTRSITYGRRVLTPTEAYTELTDGTRVPLFGSSVRHGLGYCPAIGVFKEQPPAGWTLPPVPDDLLSAQIALNLALSDCLDIAAYQVPVREYLLGPGATQAAQHAATIDVRDITPIDTAGEASEYQHVTVNPAPSLSTYTDALEVFLRTWCANSFVTPESVINSTGITGAAKEHETLAIRTEAERNASVLRDAEQDLAELAADVLRHEGVQAVPRPRVAVRYHYPEARGNDLQSAQARALRGRFGEIDPVAEYARAEGIEDTAAARDTLAARLSAWRDLFGDMSAKDTPGMDATAAAL